MSVFMKISNKVLLIINGIAVGGFLLACVNPYINAQTWPLFSLISLAFPFLLLMVLAFFFWWLLIKRKWALLSGIALLLGGGAITDFFAFKYFNNFSQTKKASTIRIATWNVARFIEQIKNNNKGSQTRHKMLDQIKEVNADILCFQEFSSSINPDWYDNIMTISKGLGYRYYYFYHDEDGDNFFNGNVIFSRLPITDTGMVRYPRPTLPDALVFADIQVGKKKLRIYNTHLQSNQFRKQDLAKNAKGDMWNNVRNIVSKLRVAIKHRAIQSDMVESILKNSPYPVIFCGDLNDVPNSYTYKTIKAGMQDAFLNTGSGIGRTYASLSPTLRIDYIFTDPDFSIVQSKRITTRLSDHYMVVADVKF